MASQILFCSRITYFPFVTVTTHFHLTTGGSRNSRSRKFPQKRHWLIFHIRPLNTRSNFKTEVRPLLRADGAPPIPTSPGPSSSPPAKPDEVIVLVLRVIGWASSWYDEALPCLFLDPRKGVRGLARLKQHGASSWASRETSTRRLA